MENFSELLDSGTIFQGDLLILIGFLKKLVNSANGMLSWLYWIILNGFDRNHPNVILVSFFIFEYIVFKFEAYMLPLILLVYVAYRLVADFDIDIAPVNPGQVELADNLNIPPTTQQALMELIDSLQDMLPTFAYIQQEIAKILQAMDLTLISWKTCKILLGITLKIYHLGFRHFLMISGIGVLILIHPWAQAALRHEMVRKLVKIIWKQADDFLNLFPPSISNMLTKQQVDLRMLTDNPKAAAAFPALITTGLSLDGNKSLSGKENVLNSVVNAPESQPRVIEKVSPEISQPTKDLSSSSGLVINNGTKTEEEKKDSGEELSETLQNSQNAAKAAAEEITSKPTPRRRTNPQIPKVKKSIPPITPEEFQPQTFNNNYNNNNFLQSPSIRQRTTNKVILS